MRTYNKRIDFRATEDQYDKLLAICRAEKRAKSRVLTDLIEEKFKEKPAYTLQFLKAREEKTCEK